MGKAPKEPFGTKGVSIRAVNLIMLAAAVILSALLLIFAYRTVNGYGRLQAVTEEYMHCRQDATDLMEASDYLTEMAREFVVTGNRQAALDFAEEVETSRRRELALEDLGRYFAGSDAYTYLNSALDESNRLAETEYYAMRLYISGRGYDISDYPGLIADVALDNADEALSGGEKIEKAIDLVFGGDYAAGKSAIREEVSNCLSRLIIEEIEARQQTIEKRFVFDLRVQTILIILLLVSVAAVIILNFRLVINPLTRSVSGIRSEGRIPLVGSREMRFVAETFNSMFEQSRRDRDQLSYEASHDELTGLYNRGVFEKVRAEYSRGGDIAMMIVDVDYFKQINDTYGHDMGDRVLKSVAGVLRSSFRHEDYVCRIGGDEFVVVMVNVTSKLKDLVERKLRDAAKKLGEPQDDLPKITLSVGIAFGDRENPTGDIYKDADTALYRVKDAGRNGIMFY